MPALCRHVLACCMVGGGAEEVSTRSMASVSLVPLDTPALRGAFSREVAELNRQRLRVIGPIMVVVHVVHIWVFWVAAAQRGALAADVLRARHDLMLMHCTMAPLTGLLTVLVFRSRGDVIPRLMGPVVATLYLVHGAICT